MDICLHLKLTLMDKVSDGYIIPLHNAKAPKDITDLSMVYSLVHRYKQTTSIYQQLITFAVSTDGKVFEGYLMALELC